MWIFQRNRGTKGIKLLYNTERTTLKSYAGENEETDKIIRFVNAKTIGRECTSKQILRLDEMRKRLMERFDLEVDNLGYIDRMNLDDLLNVEPLKKLIGVTE